MNNMLYNKTKRLLSEGMSLDQIKQGLNADLLRMLNDFRENVYSIQHETIHKLKKDFLRQINLDDNIMSEEEYSRRYEQTRNMYADYVLVEIIENGGLSLSNPIKIGKGKFTEFILRIISSKYFKNSEENWDIITEFLKICKNSGSNIYKSKNHFFDTSIIPLLDKRVANGEKLGSVNPETGIRGSSFGRPAPNAPLQDKVLKVFDAYGNYNGINLLQAIMDEVELENKENTVSFAGYDVKLINFCLQKGYWKEFNVPGQAGGVRLFFIGNGDLESIKNLDDDIAHTSTYEDDTYEYAYADAYENWSNMENEEQERYQSIFERYLEYYLAEIAPTLSQESSLTKSFPYYHVCRGLTYASNVYPFKTAYNIMKKNIKQYAKTIDIPYISSVNDEDFVVINDNHVNSIRNTTSWCTKDEGWVVKYTFPKSQEKVEGFILCLNNNLPFNDPDGALQIGIRKDYDIRGNVTGKYNCRNLTLNADDIVRSCPSYLNNVFKNENSIIIDDLILQDKKQYDHIRNLNFPENKDLRSDEKKTYFDQMQQLQKLTNENLIRRYVRQLLK